MASSRKRNVEIDVVTNDKQARVALKGLADETTKTGQAFSNMGKMLVGAFAFDKIKDFVGDSVRAFSDLNESQNAVAVTFGDASDEVKKLGKEAARSVGLSNAEFNSLSVQMSAFAQTIAGDSGDVAGTIDTLTTRVADFASVMNLDVAEAARLFQSGLAGETEPLRKFGIDLSAAAVTAHGVAMGLGDASGKLSEQEKILARYDSLMGQTDKTAGDFANTSDQLANSQRILAAETENAKAMIGENFAVAMQAAIPLLAGAAKGAGMLATMFGDMTGTIEGTDAAIRLFELSTGTTADTGAALLTILKEFGGDMQDLIPVMNLSAEEMNKLRDADDDFLLSLGFTHRDIQLLNRLLEDELVAATQSARDRGMHPLKGATEEVKDEVEDTTSALRDFEDEVMSQVDPLYGLVSAQNDVAAAIQAVKDLEKKHKEDTPEYVAALLEQAQKFEALRVAQLKVAEQSGLTRAQFESHLVNMGTMTREQIDIILAEFDRVEAFQFTGKTITIDGKKVGFGLPRAHGGPVQPGGTYTVGEQGPETLVMGNQGGTIIPNGGGMGGGSETIIIQIDGETVARAVRKRQIRDNRSGRPWT